MLNVFDYKLEQKVSETLIAGEDYVVVKDGHGYDHKIVNLNNPKYCAREGIVEVEASKYARGERGAFKHLNYKMFRCIIDKQTGLIWGEPTKINPETKDLQFKTFTIEDRMVFDLSIPSQAKAWAIIKNSPFIEGSPNQHGKSVYRVIDKEKSAKLSIDKRSLRRKAEDIIANLNESLLMEMAVNLGVNTQANKKLSMLTDEVYRVAELDPKAFLDIFNSQDREYITVFNKAMSKGIIKHDIVLNAYMYGAISMGTNKESAIKFLIDNANIAAALNSKCQQLDAETVNSMKVNNVDNEKAKLAQQVVELKQKLANLSKNSTEEVKFEDPFKEMVDDKKESSGASQETRDKAKALGIKGYALPLISEEKLLEKIQEAESLNNSKE